MPRRKCTFQDVWLKHEKYKEWIERDVSDSNSARCCACRKSFCMASMGESAVRSHGEGAKHKTLLEKMLASSRGTIGPISDFFGTVRLRTTNVTNGSSSTIVDSDPIHSPCGSGLSSHLVTEDVIKSEILWTLRTIEHHCSYKSNKGMEKTFQRMFPDSRICLNCLTRPRCINGYRSEMLDCTAEWVAHLSSIERFQDTPGLECKVG